MNKLKVERNLVENKLTIDGVEFTRDQTEKIDDFLDCFAKKRVDDTVKEILLKMHEWSYEHCTAEIIYLLAQEYGVSEIYDV